MSLEQNFHSDFFSQIHVSPEPLEIPAPESQEKRSPVSEMNSVLKGMNSLMKDMIAAQDRQNELLEELVGQISMVHRQRMFELASWKQANPDLAYFCKTAADKLGKIQTEMLSSITNQIEEEFTSMIDNEFELSDFVDRFGPRFAHLNGLLQVLAQLGNAPDLVPSVRPYAK